MYIYIHFLFHQVLSNQEEAANTALLSLAWTKRDPPFSLLNLCYLSFYYGYYLLGQNVTFNHQPQNKSNGTFHIYSICFFIWPLLR